MTFLGFTGLINFITCFIVSVLVIIKNIKSPLNRSFFNLNLSVALYSFGYFFWQISKDQTYALFWFKILTVGIILINVTYLYFVFYFLDLIGQKIKLLRILLVINAIFIVLNFTSNLYTALVPRYNLGFWPTPTIFFNLYLIFWFWQCFYGFYWLIKEFQKQTGIKQLQIKYFTISAMLGFAGGATNWPMWYGIYFPPYSNIAISLYIGVVAYAILRHQLLDIRVALTRAGIFIAVYTLVLGLPFWVGYVTRSWLFSTGVAVTLATLGPYLYIYIDRRAEEKLFKALTLEQKTLKTYKKDLEIAARGMIEVHKPEALIRLVVRTMVQKVKAGHADILLYDRSVGSYMLVSRRPSGVKTPEDFTRMEQDNPLIKLFKELKSSHIYKGGALVYKEMKNLLAQNPEAGGQEDLLKRALHQMEMHGAAVCIPSYFRGELLAVLLLGNKINDEEFAQDELDFFVALASDVASAIRNAQLFKEVREEAERNQQLFLGITIALATSIEAKDAYTRGHTGRVTRISLAIAKKLKKKLSTKITDQFLKDLRLASLFHDIGKIGTPEAILNKQAPLTPEEAEVIKKHPLIGASILEAIPELKDVILGVKYHHQKYDGTGYPEHLKQDQIPLIAAIIAVADTLDAMTTNRPYRAALSLSDATEEIRRYSGIQFDPVVATALLELHQEGQLVEKIKLGDIAELSSFS